MKTRAKNPESSGDVMVLLDNYCKLRSIDNHLNSILELKNEINLQFLPFDTGNDLYSMFNAFALNKESIRNIRMFVYKELEKLTSTLQFDNSDEII